MAENGETFVPEGLLREIKTRKGDLEEGLSKEGTRVAGNSNFTANNVEEEIRIIEKECDCSNNDPKYCIYSCNQYTVDNKGDCYKKSFPKLFPYGCGDPSEERVVNTSKKCEGMGYDNITAEILKKGYEEIERNKIGQYLPITHETKVGMNFIKTVDQNAGKVWGSNAERQQYRRELFSTIDINGQPHIFLTFTPETKTLLMSCMAGDLDVDKFLKKGAKHKFPIETILGGQNVPDYRANPKLFDKYVKILLETALGYDTEKNVTKENGGLLGHIRDYYSVVETQGSDSVVSNDLPFSLDDIVCKKCGVTGKYERVTKLEFGAKKIKNLEKCKEPKYIHCTNCSTEYSSQHLMRQFLLENRPNDWKDKDLEIIGEIFNDKMEDFLEMSEDMYPETLTDEVENVIKECMKNEYEQDEHLFESQVTKLQNRDYLRKMLLALPPTKSDREEKVQAF
eukprot:Awhi_evm1s12867